MINSNERKQKLIDWINDRHTNKNFSNARLQTFLFLYEALSKIENDIYDLKDLQGCRNGLIQFSEGVINSQIEELS